MLGNKAGIGMPLDTYAMKPEIACEKQGNFGGVCPRTGAATPHGEYDGRLRIM